MELPLFSSLACGPGTLVLARLPGRDGDIQGDMSALQGLGPDLVVSLIEPTESPHDLAAGFAARGLTSVSWPIRDFGTPPPDADWDGLCALALPVVQRGGCVLIHCHGGRGRSGMIALRLMLTMGEPASTALPRLRAARPGAIETDAQMQWATTGQATP